MIDDKDHQEPKQSEDPKEVGHPQEPGEREERNEPAFVPDPTEPALDYRNGDDMSDGALLAWATYRAKSSD